ncbi:MAG: hypothetical protein EON96_18210 [Caulobacteraceae bacterium]|nr:MAG: hypothetical protein EON96_18210 [Caulobacteraceae bacterium]
MGRGAAGYAEFNLSPSSEWAAYAFTGYREGRTDLDTTSPEIVLHRTRDRFDVKGVVTLPDDATGPIGLSAVIESTDGLTSYWALAHPSDKPDFHHPDSFTLVLPAAEQT